MKASETASTRALRRVKTLENDFNMIHGNYNYSKFVYTTSKTKSTIICNLHGEFQQCANDHLNGYGCPLCGRAKVAEARRKGAAEFIRQAIAKHGSIMDYSKVNYTTTKTKVIITCPVHGDFKQQPMVHLASKYPCIKCASTDGGLLRRNSTTSFIAKARKVHSDLYDYRNTVVKTTNDKVIITCKAHGDFEQLQSNHLAGNGCPICGLTGFQESKPAILYYVSVDNGKAYKIGITNRTIKQRFGADFDKITVLGYASFLTGSDARERETQILREFSEHRYTEEPLLLTGNTELFTKDILQLTRKNNEYYNT